MLGKQADLPRWYLDAEASQSPERKRPAEAGLPRVAGPDSSLATTRGSLNEPAWRLDRGDYRSSSDAGAAMRLARPECRRPGREGSTLEDANHASDSAAFYRNVDAVGPKVIGHR